MDKDLRVQIGAGLSAGPSWISYDSSPTLLISKIPLIGRPLLRSLKAPAWPASTRYGDILKGLPLPPGSCRLIFCSHMLEHLSQADARTALKNVHRYLRPGGTFRLIVPDLEVYARRYLAGLEGPGARAAGDDFIRETCLGCEPSRRPWLARLKEGMANSRHQWLWDKGSLEGLLREHGFQDVRRKRFGEWTDPSFAEIEEESRHLDAICMECTRD